VDLTPNFGFAFLCALIALSGILIYRANGGKFFEPTIPSFFLLFYSATTLVGAFLMFFHLNQGAQGRGQTHPQVLQDVLLASSTTILLVALGCIIANLLFQTNSHKDIEKFQANNLSSSFNIYPLIIIGILCLVIFIIYVSNVGGIPLLSIFQNLKGIDLARLRSDATNNFEGKFHRFSLFFHHVMPFLSFSIFAASILNRKLKPLAIGFLCLNALLLLNDLAKAPLLLFVVGLVITWMIARVKTFRFQALAMGAGLLFGLAIILKYFFMKMSDTPLIDVFLSTVDRIVGGQIVDFYHYIDYYPHVRPFLMGRGLANPGGLLPHDPVSITVEISGYSMPHLFRIGIVGSSPTAFFGTIYANFGWPLTYFGMLATGFYMQTVNTLAFRMLPRDPLGMGLVAWLVVHFARLTDTGIELIIFDTPLATVLLIYMVMRKLTPSWQSESSSPTIMKSS